MTTDVQDWASYYGIPILWPSIFPIRTVQPLRVTIASDNNPTLIRRLCMLPHYNYVDVTVLIAADEAAWRDNKNIGDENVSSLSSITFRRNTIKRF